ncbi:MAG: Tol-Pal system beta propeller repeat protein TolB [Steroidobacteraceae bacterium]
MRKTNGGRGVRGRIGFVLGWLALLAAGPAHAQLRLDITEGVKDAVPVAVVPFAGQPEGGPNDIAAVVSGDLELSGRFAPLERADLVMRPASAAEVRVEDWRLLKADYVVVGHLGDAGATVDVELVNVRTGQRMLAESVPVDGRPLRAVAHQVSDLVYERLTGIRGAFGTRLAYVAVDGRAPNRTFRLVVSDADGYNPRTVAESAQPLMSPAWSPDGASLAYVSFEGGTSAVYVQRLASGERSRVSARSGVNGAPAWSPDGGRLALTLSRDGNLDIYVLELGSQVLTRITTDEAIDTEAAWSPDGGSLYFTSDRAGNAQIYRVSLDDRGNPQRVTFTNGYNARPRVSPDGQSLAMVTLDRGYRIAVMDLKTRALRVITDGPQDESPGYAPNGAMLVYATDAGARRMLGLVSSDGAWKERLSSERGSVREPAWSPYPSR